MKIEETVIENILSEDVITTSKEDTDLTDTPVTEPLGTGKEARKGKVSKGKGKI